MPLLQNQSNGPAPIISTVNRAVDGGVSVMPYALAALVVALLFVIVLGYRVLSLQARVADAQSQQDQLASQYSSLSDIKARVANVSALATGLEVAYAAQTPIVDLLHVLESTSYKPAVYTSVSIDKKGAVRIAGSVPTYHDFAKVVKAFKGSDEGLPGVTKLVTIDSVGQSVSTDEKDAGTVTTKFAISFTLTTPGTATTTSASPSDTATDVSGNTDVTSTTTTSTVPGSTTDGVSGATAGGISQ